MSETNEISKTNEQMYLELQTAMTEDLYLFLKKHFSDICSNGDLIINSHIKMMYANKIITDLNLIDSIYYVWQEYYVQGLAADPWWAS